MSMLWGGVFGKGMAPYMHLFNKSIDFDKNLFKVDIRGSQAYAQALQQVGLLTDDETLEIIVGLEKILKEWEDGSFVIHAEDEDIHSANERRLKELIGAEIGGKLHTGRSRNDQVATDSRLFTLEAIDTLKSKLKVLLNVVCDKAEKHLDVLFPGYTHLQQAQPVLWSHWLLNHAQSFRTDLEYLDFIRSQTSVCPLGSGALAGNPFGIDRHGLSTKLGFDRPSENSMTAVADRDFIAFFLHFASLFMVHCSRLAEDIIIYCSKEFAFLKVAEEFSTGSSLMPQKKNPDSLELIRGKVGRCLGNSVALLTTLKATPSTFNKDLQEDKERLFDSYETVKMVLDVLSGCVDTLIVNPDKCYNALSSEMLATDVAYYLTRKKLPFRQAHETAGKVVREANVNYDGDMTKVPLSKLKEISQLFEEDVADLWNYKKSIGQYTCYGGTAPSAVQTQIDNLRSFLQK